MSDAENRATGATAGRRRGLWRRVGDALRGWLRGGSCRACRGHDEDVARWRKTLDERYAEGDGKRSGDRR